jgi:7-cyano-7-deazaguanine synthase in queuosine biosynthesis
VISSYFELATSDDATTDPDAKQLGWPTSGGNTTTVRASVDPWLTNLGPVSPAAIDLVRIAVAALIADRRSPRPSDWTREIRLRVHAVQPSAWAEAIETLSALLQFLSGDIWDVELVEDSSSAPVIEDEPGEAESSDAAALFSGGLDSFCGAVISETAGGSHWYVSQRDNPTVAGSQNRASEWLRSNVRDGFDPLAITLAQAQQTIEVTSRTRSLLFLALGIATAEAKRCPKLVVAENGFTSLNPPLRVDRSGPLSTRSTHPYAFALLNLIREQVGVDVEIENPYAWLTKGELVAEAIASNAATGTGIATTLSCAKLDGRLYKGGNQNWNCGLCAACIIRRGAVAAAGVQDETPYIVTSVSKSAVKKLVERRRSDIQAMRWAVAAGADGNALIGSAEFPVEFDIDRGIELWERALKEIELVELP